MDLRPALPDDAPRLGAFGRDAFVAAFGHLYQARDLDPFLEQVYGEAAIRDVIRDAGQAVQLAMEDDRIVGYCRLQMACRWPEHARGRSAIELKQLYTSPSRTGGGIGALLMDWAIDTARAHRADEIQLSVWSGNHGAQRFYHRYGFTKTADIAFWVNTHRDDEFLFARMLDDAPQGANDRESRI